ncbi:MAG: UDP-N-acetylmuramate--L-alanine ligase [Lentisphaerae bacterium ADurb.Bin242]|nr:MAG: UDP-N-acetylmuramate--L-alanine ligase [Lentisphaerae bacterium ADurb.Bin242]
MMNLNEYKNPLSSVHFIGCEGAGTRPLRKIFAELGFQTSGSDMILNGHDVRNLPTADGSKLLVVYSSAIPADNPELVRAREIGAECILRGEALGFLAGLFQTVIAVSGSHGKTSVTAMIAHLLKENGLEPGYMVGGKVNTWEESGSAGAGKIFVCEADESDGTHTAIHSSVAVVTNVEDDHVWNFESPEKLKENFRTFTRQGKMLVSPDNPLFSGHPNYVKLPLNALLEGKEFETFGHYSRINLNTAVETVVRSGLLESEKALKAARTYPGVARRMEHHCSTCTFSLYEDYAHHPTELAASIRSFRELYPGRKLTVVFQPHRFARLKKYFHEFAYELGKADRVFITPVFAAWTASDTLSSRDLAKAIGDKARALEGSWESMARTVRDSLEYGGLIAVIGAGDIKEIIEPLNKILYPFHDVGVIVAAGGSSERFGTGNKLFEDLGGVPVFIRTLLGLAPVLEKKNRIFLPVPEALRAEFEEHLKKYLPSSLEVTVVSGGKTRTESVKNALKAMPPEVKIVAVHDAARPFVTPVELEDCVEACSRFGGAISATRITDTVKEADPDNRIVRTLPREKLWAVQTPQVFRRELLEKAYAEAEKSDRAFPDDASLVETFTDTRVKLVQSYTYGGNRKITYPEDLETARCYVSGLAGKVSR